MTTARAVALALVGVAMTVPAAPGRADSSPGPTGVVVFARDGALWAIAPDGSGEPVAVARPASGGPAFQSLDVAAAGLAVARASDGSVWWTQLHQGAVRRLARARRCAGRAFVFPTGDRFACRADERTVLIQPALWGPTTTPVAGELGGVTPAGELVVADDAAIYAAAAASPAARRRVAPHRPSGGWLSAPDGQRAVGRYADGAPDPSGGAYQFALDGKAARRRLATDATPITWSLDARWLLLQTARGTCFVRAVGGEYKCWDRFQGVAVAPRADYVLLARDGVLYVAATDGVTPARPRRLVDRGEPAAAWLERLPGAPAL